MECLSFKEWLIQEKEFSQRAAQDVLSRCKRAEAILPADDYTDDSYYFFKLTQEDSFKKLSVSVRSQIKRALKLKSEYTQLLQ